MNKIKKIIIIVFIAIIALIVLIFVYNYKYSKQIENEKNVRYLEIKEAIIKGVEANLEKEYPNCPIVSELPQNNGTGSHYNSSYLIDYGYIKQKDLLDYDGKSYCDFYVEIKTYRKNQFDTQKDCNVAYELFLKCIDYEEKGYQNWGN